MFINGVKIIIGQGPMRYVDKAALIGAKGVTGYDI